MVGLSRLLPVSYFRSSPVLMFLGLLSLVSSLYLFMSFSSRVDSE